MKLTAFHSRPLLTGLCCAALLAPGLTTRAAMQAAGNPRAAQSQGAPASAPKESAFLRVILPKQQLVVGEMVPVKVKAYFRAGVSASLNGLPMLSSDAFTLNKLGEHPEQTREAINGVPYTVVTWTSALSAVKAGDYPLNIDLPVMVRVQEKVRRRGGGHNPFKDFFGDDSPFGDAFSDSFFDDFFAQATEKPLTLHNDGGFVQIDPLPAQGRPASFTGAVGQFEISSEVATANATAGDPLSLKTTISGTGNFDRVTTAGLPASSAWKTYKPSAQFDANDASGIAGTKTFSQSIIPVQAGAQQIPSVAFSYFDPDSKQYVTKQTAPISVHVAPGSAAAAAPVLPEAATAPKTAADGLAPDEPPTGRSVTSLRPLVLTPWFVVFNGVLAAALVVGGAWLWWQARRARNPERLQRAAAEKAARAALAELAAAQAAQDAPRFFNAGRHALQEQLAAHWQVPAARVTLPEIQARLNGHGAEIRAVFQTADELAYSGRRFSVPDLREWRTVIENQLQQIPNL